MRLALLAVITLMSCRNNQSPDSSGKVAKALEVPPGCKTFDLVRCLQPYAFEEFSSKDIERLVTEGMRKCLSREPWALRAQAACLPRQLGTDRRIGLPLMLSYACEDNCPAAGGVSLAYGAQVDLEACCAIGGAIYQTWAFGRQYMGCGPPEALVEHSKESIESMRALCKR